MTLSSHVVAQKVTHEQLMEAWCAKVYVSLSRWGSWDKLSGRKSSSSFVYFDTIQCSSTPPPRPSNTALATTTASSNHRMCRSDGDTAGCAAMAGGAVVDNEDSSAGVLSAAAELGTAPDGSLGEKE